MEGEIRNRVAESSLITFDLEDFYPTEILVTIDIEQWLHMGIALKEKEFREALKNHPWEDYKNQLVVLENKNEAIVPSWTFMLIAAYLNPLAKKVSTSVEALLIAHYKEALDSIDLSAFEDKPMIIKGCSNKEIPEEIYLLAVEKFQNVAKSLMFGEACSSVPLYKKKRQ